MFEKLLKRFNLIKRSDVQVQVKKMHNIMARNFAAASTGRLYNSWTTTNYSADSILHTDLKSLRARSRDLERNNPYAKKIFKMIMRNTVGPNGFQLQSLSLDDKGEYDETDNQAIEDAFFEWSKKENCDITQELSFRDIQRCSVQHMARDGEILIRKIRGADNPFGFALQLLEADHLDENHNNDLGNGHKIRMGKEYDEWGRCVAYHILKQHPGDTMFATYSYGDKIVVPADQIIHLYLKDRISGSRGQPWLHAAMTSLNMLGGYMEAELTAARIAAAKMGFYEMQDMAGMDDMEAETENDDGTGDLIQSVEPGMLEKLPPGVRFTGFTPDHPTNAFPDFVKVLLRSIAASIDVSYNYMANDLENVNYSSLRGGKIDENDVWKDLHQFMVDHFFNPSYDDWLKMAILNKKLNLPFSKLAKYKNIFWQPRGFQWVDPVKEVASDKMAVASGFKSEQMVVSGLGYDLETVYRQQKRAKIMREKYGIITENEAKITEMLGKVDDDNDKN